MRLAQREARAYARFARKVRMMLIGGVLAVVLAHFGMRWIMEVLQ